MTKRPIAKYLENFFYENPFMKTGFKFETSLPSLIESNLYSQKKQL